MQLCYTYFFYYEATLVNLNSYQTIIAINREKKQPWEYEKFATAAFLLDDFEDETSEAVAAEADEAADESNVWLPNKE